MPADGAAAAGTGSFRDRRAAGRALAALVGRATLDDPVVLGLPRGGVPVAAEVARSLGVPIDVYVVRKIGAPFQPEFGVGALAEDGVPLFDLRTLDRLGLSPAAMEPTVRAEQAELGRRITRYRGDRPLPGVDGRDVVLVNDGLATGVTARAALRALRRLRPRRLVLAVPVCAPVSVGRLRRDADEVLCVSLPEPFGAVGQFYDDFRPTSDGEVLSLLAAAREVGAHEAP